MDFEPPIQALVDAGVDFMIIGGCCATLHGSAMITLDLDVFYSRKLENLRRLVEALAPFHPRLRDLPEGLPFVWEVATLANGTLFTLQTDLGKVDLFAEVKGLGSFEEVRADSVEVQAFGRRIRTLNLKNLIASKRAAGRDKDAIAVRELESLLEAQESEGGR